MYKTLGSILVLVVACGGGSKPPAEPGGTAEPVTTAPVAQPAASSSPPVQTTAPAEPPAADPEQAKAELLAAEMAAYEKAKPVFEKFCARCHAQGNRGANKKKLEHFDMTKYPFTGEHPKKMSSEVREVLGIGGGKVTMPPDKKGAVKGDDLAAIAAWADAFDAAQAGGAHDDAK